MNQTSKFSLLAALLCVLMITAPTFAAIVTFGSGANQFNMEFVQIGLPGNPGEFSNGRGAVSYNFQIGKYEVSEDMINKFNASQSLIITPDTRGSGKPATSVSWNEAARFVNWLNISQGFPAAYNFITGSVNDDIALWARGDSGYNMANPFRNSNAQYFLPSIDEWYKAAYYNPNANGGLGGYWLYGTGSNDYPTPVASGTTANTAVIDQAGPADVTAAGGLNTFGVMGMAGNVGEIVETEIDAIRNDSPSSDRVFYDSYYSRPDLWPKGTEIYRLPTVKLPVYGFRVASLSAIPEPSTYALVLTGLTALGWSQRKRWVNSHSRPQDTTTPFSP